MHIHRQLSKIQFDYQTLSETTVIMLHLEVRSHCFYYLQPALHKVTVIASSFTEDIHVDVDETFIDMTQHLTIGHVP